jgi:NADPH:quinone reductase-like Zn-dependent oxidoreductase
MYRLRGVAMKAVRIHQFGGPEVLKVEDIPIPEPKGGEFLVRVNAAGVNPVDYKIRSGKYPAVKEDQLPMTLGRDVSGVVERGGSDGGPIKKGDAVFAMLGPDRGGYAEYAIVKMNEAARKPDRINHIEAGGAPLAALTAWQGLFDHGNLRSGQRVLIHGGAGGVGHFAVQFAKAKGAWVATTAASQDLDFLMELGAGKVIDYKAQKFEEEVRDIDLVYDLIGGETQERSFAVLKPGGMLVSTLQQPDSEKLNKYNVRGMRYMAQPSAAELSEIGDLLSSGKVRVVVSKTYPLVQASDAQKELEHGHVRGKIVLVCF